MSWRKVVAVYFFLVIFQLLNPHHSSSMRKPRKPLLATENTMLLKAGRTLWNITAVDTGMERKKRGSEFCFWWSFSRPRSNTDTIYSLVVQYGSESRRRIIPLSANSLPVTNQPLLVCGMQAMESYRRFPFPSAVLRNPLPATEDTMLLMTDRTLCSIWNVFAIGTGTGRKAVNSGVFGKGSATYDSGPRSRYWLNLYI